MEWWKVLFCPAFFLFVGTFPRKLFRVPARPDSCASWPVRFLFHFKFFPIITAAAFMAICRPGQGNSWENMHIQSGFLVPAAVPAFAFPAKVRGAISI